MADLEFILTKLLTQEKFHDKKI